MIKRPGVTMLYDKRIRFMASVMILFGAGFAVIPGLIPGDPGREFLYAWYGFLILWWAFWGYLFVRNTHFYLAVEDTRLVWTAGFFNPRLRKVELVDVKCLVVETTPVPKSRNSESSWPTEIIRFFLELKDGSRVEVTNHVDANDLFTAVTAVNPRITRKNETGTLNRAGLRGRG
jgi:hypothetical protein